MKKLLAFLAILACFYIIGINLQKISWLPFGNKGIEAASIQSINMVHIDVAATDCVIVPEKRDDIKAEYKGKGKVRVTKSGDTVNITLKHNWFESFPFWNKRKLTIYFPENYDQNMDISIGSGALHFSGISKDDPMNLKDLSIDMSSGLVKLENLKVRNYSHAGTSGMAQLDWVTTNQGSIRMSSGNVELSHYNGGFNAKLSSGRLKAQLDQLNHPIDVELSSGIVKLDLPKNADFTLNAKASSGFISCDFPLDSKSGDRNNIVGTHGTGKNKVNVQVSSGTANIY